MLINFDGGSRIQPGRMYFRVCSSLLDYSILFFVQCVICTRHYEINTILQINKLSRRKSLIGVLQWICLSFQPPKLLSTISIQLSVVALIVSPFKTKARSIMPKKGSSEEHLCGSFYIQSYVDTLVAENFVLKDSELQRSRLKKVETCQRLRIRALGPIL